MCVKTEMKQILRLFCMSAFKCYLSALQRRINISLYWFLWNIFSSPGYMFYLFFFFIYVVWFSDLILTWVGVVQWWWTQPLESLLKQDSLTMEFVILGLFNFLCAHLTDLVSWDVSMTCIHILWISKKGCVCFTHSQRLA